VKKKRSAAVIAIVLYKCFQASLLATTSVALLLTLKNYQELRDFSASFEFEGKAAIVNGLLDRVLNLNPGTLRFAGIAAALYAIVTLIEAVGLWYEKTWAHVLVICLIGFSIPPEIFELLRGVSTLKLAVFLVNAAIFWYLLHHLFLKKKQTH
jgi:uncharacterized membrane protein (DUF2068 family)